MVNFQLPKIPDSFYKGVTDFQGAIAERAENTQLAVRERFGQVSEKTELPPDYIELEKRCDAIKFLHVKLLSVTKQYNNEAYDYPPNLAESFNDLSRTVTEKYKQISASSTAGEAGSAAAAPVVTGPKTFNHAIARAALAGSQKLTEPESHDPTNDPLPSALERYAVAQERVGNARLNQDSLIGSRFLAPWQTTLNTSITFATDARNEVLNARRRLDNVKAKARRNEKTQADVDHAEDEFVQKVENATGRMKDCLDSPEPLRNLLELLRTQREFYKTAASLLEEVEGDVEHSLNEQEDMFRKSRQNA